MPAIWARRTKQTFFRKFCVYGGPATGLIGSPVDPRITINPNVDVSISAEELALKSPNQKK